MGKLMEIEGQQNNKQEHKTKCYNCNRFGHIAKDCQQLKNHKENSIEFLLDFLHYLYNYYIVCALLSHAYHVTHYVISCDVML